MCLNACVLARAATRRGKTVFSSGQEVLKLLPAETIAVLAERYAALSQRQNPSCCQSPEEIAALRKALAESPYERLKWQVLRRFGVLPSEPRARQMTDGDYLYCVLQMMLDDEAERDRLCPCLLYTSLQAVAERLEPEELEQVQQALQQKAAELFPPQPQLAQSVPAGSVCGSEFMI